MSATPCTKFGRVSWHRTVKGTLERYGQHDSNCAAVQPMRHKGHCDCGWSAACKALRIDEERAGMPAERFFEVAPRYSGARRVDTGAVLALSGGPTTAEDRGKWLVACEYRLVDRRYLAVARLPPGQTGREALCLAFDEDNDPGWINDMTDEAAGDHFRRVYAYYTGAPLLLELDRETFAAFMAAGGKEAL